MVTTRAKSKLQDHGSGGAGEPKTGQKRSRAQAPKTQAAESKGKKQKGDPGNNSEDAPSKSDTQQEPKKKPLSNEKVDRLIRQHDHLPLSDTVLEEPGTPTADTLLALLLHAMLSSTRVSHAIAAKTTSLVIKAGYHKLDVLKKSTWEERTEVLTQGGYTHYR